MMCAKLSVNATPKRVLDKWDPCTKLELGCNHCDQPKPRIVSPVDRGASSRIRSLRIMPKALRPCATPGCPNLVPTGTTRCDSCDTVKQADYRSRRDPVTHAHYKSRGHARFRRLVLARDPVCVLCHDAIATDADHWPRSLRELLEAGANPNDPAHGRGLCHSCHAKETTRLQPGGWNKR